MWQNRPFQAELVVFSSGCHMTENTLKNSFKDICQTDCSPKGKRHPEEFKPNKC
jgi:hypothetical protein